MMCRFNYTSWKWQFLGKNISQGSVETHLRCGGIFNNHSTTNFSNNVLVKEFRKSIKIWHKFGVPFFETQCREEQVGGRVIDEERVLQGDWTESKLYS